MTGCAVATNSCVQLGQIRLVPLIVAFVGLDVLLLIRTNGEVIWGVLAGIIAGSAIFLRTTDPALRDNVFWAQCTNFCVFCGGFGGAVHAAASTRHRVLGYVTLMIVIALFILAENGGHRGSHR